MTRIVINNCFGGFDLREDEWARLKSLGVERYRNDDDLGNMHWSIPWRAHPEMIRIAEERIAKEGPHCELSIVEIPDGVEWEIGCYDGREWIAEKHRRWSAPDEDE